MWPLLAVRDGVRVVLAQEVPVKELRRPEERRREPVLLVVALVLIVPPPLGLQRLQERLIQELVVRTFWLALPRPLLVGRVRHQLQGEPKQALRPLGPPLLRGLQKPFLLVVPFEARVDLVPPLRPRPQKRGFVNPLLRVHRAPSVTVFEPLRDLLSVLLVDLGPVTPPP